MDISRVNGVEHNCSLAHNDIPWDHEYPRLHSTADVCLLNKLFADSSDQLTLSVEDILAARDRLLAGGARVLGDGTPKQGAHDRPVVFLHPKDFSGTLIELEQA